MARAGKEQKSQISPKAGETLTPNTPKRSPAQIKRLEALGERLNQKNRCKLAKNEKTGSYYSAEPETGMAILQAMEATGTTNQDAANLLIGQVVNAQAGRDQLDCANAAVALMQGIDPQDELEGLLAAQMVATHNLSMEYARRAMGKDVNRDQADSLINRTTKLMNVFTRQVEALNKYRNRGQQKITVQHVQVSDGGQAIIGDVHQGEK